MLVQVRLETGMGLGNVELDVVPRHGDWFVMNGVRRTVRHVEHHALDGKVNTVRVVLKPSDVDIPGVNPP